MSWSLPYYLSRDYSSDESTTRYARYASSISEYRYIGRRLDEQANPGPKCTHIRFYYRQVAYLAG